MFVCLSFKVKQEKT